MLTKQEMASELARLNIKLKLWETPGFFQFIEDLTDIKGIECDLKGPVSSLKKIYDRRKDELTDELYGKTMLKQLKMDL